MMLNNWIKTQYVSFVGEVKIDCYMTDYINGITRQIAEKTITDDVTDYWSHIVSEEIYHLMRRYDWEEIASKDSLTVYRAVVQESDLLKYVAIWAVCERGGWHELVVLPANSDIPEIMSPPAVPSGCDVRLS